MWDLPGPGIEPVYPCIGRWILNHCATREVPGKLIHLFKNLLPSVLCVTVDLSISLFTSVSFCFVYFRTLLLGIYPFVIGISPDELLHNYKMYLFLSGHTPYLET